MTTTNKSKRRNLYHIFQRKFERCIKNIMRRAPRLEEHNKIIKQLIEEGYIEIKTINVDERREHYDPQKHPIIIIKQKKEIKNILALWIVFDAIKDRSRELWYQLGPFVKQEGYTILVATQSSTKNYFKSRVLLEEGAHLILYSINEFAPSVESYTTSLEISLQKGSKLTYNAFTIHAPRIFNSLIKVHGNKNTQIRYNAHFNKVNYYTTHHQWILSENSKLNISLNGVIETPGNVELNEEFICPDNKGDIHFKTDILKLSPYAHVKVNPSITIGSTASYSEMINITHFKEAYFNYLSRFGFNKKEVHDLFIYSYLNPSEFIRGKEQCSQFLIL